MSLKLFLGITMGMILVGVTMIPAFGEEFSITIPEGVGTPGCDATTSCFVPYELSIDEGDTVTWSNDDSAQHTVTRTGAGSFSSDLLMVGDVFSFTFDQLGQFPYHCTLHPWMWGIIIVGDIVDTTDNANDFYEQNTQEDTFSISLDRQFYFTGDSLTIFSDRGTTFEILDPDFNPILISQGIPPYTIIIEDSLWEKSGKYNIIVKDGLAVAQTTFFVNIEKIELADKERISLKNQKTANAFGDFVSEINSGQQVQITADISNNQNFEQDFAYTITIQDSNIVSAPIWLTGVLGSYQELSPSLSWIPEYGGTYIITIQIWNNPIDKLQISQDVVLEVIVEGEKRPIIINETNENLEDSTYELSIDEDILVGDSGDKTIDEFESIVEEIKIASFVDKEEKQEHYIVRYHSESTYREWFDTNYSEYDSMEKAVGLVGEIPKWTDSLFTWYDNSKMTNDEIQSAIKYLVDKEILIVK